MTAAFKIYEKKAESAGPFTQGKWVHDLEHRNVGPNLENVECEWEYSSNGVSHLNWYNRFGSQMPSGWK